MTLTSPFLRPAHRFKHVRIYSVVHLSHSDVYACIVTCVDGYNEWPEVICVSDISAKTVVHAVVTHRISLFDVASVITIDQERQFQSSLFPSLTKLLGFKHIKTTPCHLVYNGLLERLHRSLNQPSNVILNSQ